MIWYIIKVEIRFRLMFFFISYVIKYIKTIHTIRTQRVLKLKFKICVLFFMDCMLLLMIVKKQNLSALLLIALSISFWFNSVTLSIKAQLNTSQSGVKLQLNASQFGVIFQG